MSELLSNSSKTPHYDIIGQIGQIDFEQNKQN